MSDTDRTLGDRFRALIERHAQAGEPGRERLVGALLAEFEAYHFRLVNCDAPEAEVELRRVLRLRSEAAKRHQSKNRPADRKTRQSLEHLPAEERLKRDREMRAKKARNRRARQKAAQLDR